MGGQQCGASTCRVGPGEAAMLPLAFLKNRGFGEDAASNFTKSFSVLSFFFKGPCTPPLPCVRGMRRGHSHPCVWKGADKTQDPPTGAPQAPDRTPGDSLSTAHFWSRCCRNPASLRWLHVHSQGSNVFSATRTHFYPSMNLCPCRRVSGFQRSCAKL